PERLTSRPARRERLPPGGAWKPDTAERAGLQLGRSRPRGAESDSDFAKKASCTALGAPRWVSSQRTAIGALRREAAFHAGRPGKPGSLSEKAPPPLPWPRLASDGGPGPGGAGQGRGGGQLRGSAERREPGTDPEASALHLRSAPTAFLNRPGPPGPPAPPPQPLPTP
ncbi:PREDICTED: collagen alpha chain-like, partial [Chinchilla lanigera]|uniref:collagen alpha chain-like n=1 Tax=Chinchilla lanigera TaxID=34839 RepID=UPI000695DCBE